MRLTDDQTRSAYAWGESMSSLLDDAAVKLEVRWINRVFYTEDGRKIKKFEDIHRNEELYVIAKREFHF